MLCKSCGKDLSSQPIETISTRYGEKRIIKCPYGCLDKSGKYPYTNWIKEDTPPQQDSRMVSPLPLTKPQKQDAPARFHMDENLKVIQSQLDRVIQILEIVHSEVLARKEIEASWRKESGE